MKIEKKMSKFIRKLHTLQTDKESYFDYVRGNVYEHGYALEKLVVHENRKWHLIVYDKKTFELKAIIHCNAIGPNVVATNHIKLFQKK